MAMSPEKNRRRAGGTVLISRSSASNPVNRSPFAKPLGNLDARRDWGHAADYVLAMWLMVQQDRPDDYVIATGETHSVREFVDLAFRIADLDYRDHIVVDPALYRPSETEVLRGNPAKASSVLNWEPVSTFEDLVREMVEADCRSLEVGAGAAVA